MPNKEWCGLCKHETPCEHSRLDNLLTNMPNKESWVVEFDNMLDDFSIIKAHTDQLGNIICKSKDELKQFIHSIREKDEKEIIKIMDTYKSNGEKREDIIDYYSK